MSNSDIIAIASVVVATLAFFTTAWQTWLASKHSRLSVKPFLCWSTHMKTSPEAYEVTVTLSNKGLGPALIRERYFVFDEKHYKAPEERGQTDIEALLSTLLPDDWGCSVAGQGLPGIGNSVLPGDVFEIARLRFKPFVREHAAELNRLMMRVGFVVVFEDLYEHRAVFNTSD